jgi:FXSXX-COOH protein
MDHTHLPAAPQTRRRIPLAELASRGSGAASPALARIMPDAASAGRVDRAAFQSFSR